MRQGEESKATSPGFGSEQMRASMPASTTTPVSSRRSVGMGLSSIGGLSNLKTSSSASQDLLVKQNAELQRLANELADQLADKVSVFQPTFVRQFQT